MYPDGTKVREYPNGLVKRYNLDGTVESIKQSENSQVAAPVGDGTLSNSNLIEGDDEGGELRQN